MQTLDLDVNGVSSETSTPSSPIEFISNPCFADINFDDFWRAETEDHRDVDSVSPSARRDRTEFGTMFDAPLLSHAEEQNLFFRLNYLKYRANSIRKESEGESLTPATAEQITTLLARATYIRNRIVESNTRLVISIVKTLVDENNTLEDLLSEGLNCMMHAVDKFDHDRGFRFSTYATLAVRRDIYRLVQRSHRLRTKFATGTNNLLEDQLSEDLPAERTESALMKIHHCLTHVLGKLDEREQFIVKARYGLIDLGMKPTFSKLGENLGVSKERVRQLEMRAMNKLRGFLDAHKNELVSA